MKHDKSNTKLQDVIKTEVRKILLHDWFRVMHREEKSFLSVRMRQVEHHVRKSFDTIVYVYTYYSTRSV